ncbi:acyl-CoA dehydrogenase [Streptomyces agglomeratus]|uniref:Acyl-CoA dehydrogenase n=1 Tax=Streptomyces agglomeratus TaxID=285458 RepID=A0A1E5PFQ5_9ACTN|nr:acyl-CoA dehydrogenase family protein [Streptomyces agglomeratus]OEJ28325.1 acyl-CoA dehydrogenase [Streptomyces agglomeratus]
MVADEAIWARVTRELADDLAVDAPARDRAGKPPFDEVSRLREAGLPALLTPPGPAGRGAHWRTACSVVREISAADGSIGELLAHHYALSWSARFFGSPEKRDAFESRAVAEQWLLGGSTHVEGKDAGSGLTLTPVRGGYVLDGRGGFRAGVTVADRLVLGATCRATREHLIVLVDPDHTGVRTDTANDRLGQRLSGAGEVDFDHVPVSADQVLGALPRDEHTASPFTSLAPLALSLLLAHVGLGIAEGALAEARDISRGAPPARLPASAREEYADRPGGDPYVLLAYGELATAAHTAAAVTERAAEALARGLLAGPQLGVDDRADIAVRVAAAEAVTSRSATHITARVLELTDDADALDGGAGLDRFWRDAHALTAGTSAAHRLRDIGDDYLNGTHPRLTRGT